LGGTSQYRGDSAKILVEISVEPVKKNKNNLLKISNVSQKNDVENQGCYSHAQGNVGLANMRDPKQLDLAVSHVKITWV